MCETFSVEWQCQNCPKKFQSGEDLSNHTIAFRSRAQLIQTRMHELTLEWQNLISELQQVLTHSESNIPHGHHNVENNNAGNHERLSCPHSDCKCEKQTYTELRSLQRHYRTHVRCTKTCPPCQREFETTVRTYENHLDRCLKNMGTASTKRAAISQRKDLYRIAREELERIMLSNDQSSVGKQVQATVAKDGTHINGHPELVTTGHMPNNMNTSTGPCQLETPSLTENGDAFNFAPNGAESSPLRYSRGTLFSVGPMDWGFAHSMPLSMTAFGPAVPDANNDGTSCEGGQLYETEMVGMGGL